MPVTVTARFGARPSNRVRSVLRDSTFTAWWDFRDAQTGALVDVAGVTARVWWPGGREREPALTPTEVNAGTWRLDVPAEDYTGRWRAELRDSDGNAATLEFDVTSPEPDFVAPPTAEAVRSVNGKLGPEIDLTAEDIGADAAGTASGAVAAEADLRAQADALLAPKASPTFTGTPAAPTPELGTNSAQIQTAAGVLAEITAGAARMTVSRTSAGAVARPIVAKVREWLTVADFGTIGTSDDGPVLATAIAGALEEGLPLSGANRTYRIRNPIVLSGAARHVWRDMTLDMSAQDSVISVSGAAELVRQVCTAPTFLTNLSGDADRVMQFNVSDASGLSVDQWLLIVSDRNMTSYDDAPGVTGTYTRAAELVRVEGISGSNVRLYQRLRGTYLQANTARLYAVQTAGGLDFSRVSIIASGRAITTQQRAIASYCGFRNVFRDVSVTNARRAGLAETLCIGTRATGWTFVNDSLTPNGYGISASGVHDCSYGTISGHRNRHVFTSTAAPSGYLDLCARDIMLGDIVATEALGSIIDAHPGVGLIVAGNVRAQFAQSGSQYSPVQTGEGADESSPAIFSQGGGILCGDVHVSGGSTGGVSLQSYGWRDANFEPTIKIDHLHIAGGRSSAVKNENFTNRSGTYTPQRQVIIVQSWSGRSDAGISARAEQGDVMIHIGGGRMRVESTEALRIECPAARSGITSEPGRGVVRLFGVEIDYAGTGNGLRIDGDPYYTRAGAFGGLIFWRGGWHNFTAMRNDDGYVLLDRVEEAAGTPTRAVVGVGEYKVNPQTSDPVTGRQTIGLRSPTQTIVGGVLTIPAGFGRIPVDTEGLASTDDVDTINGGNDGDIVVFTASNTTRDIVFRNATGNLRIGASITLDSNRDALTLYYDAADAVWRQVAFANNGT
jgi:hypothetical protein